MQWWCSARDVAWSWSWRPYAGVWVLVAGLVWAWFVMRRAARRAGAGGGGETAAGVASDRAGERGRAAWWLAGVLVLWASLDWPIGALSGYLASAHMLQFLGVALIAPPMLLMGLPRGILLGLHERPHTRAAVAFMTRPLVAFLAFNLILVGTHLPVVVDALMDSQLGSLAIDALWLAGGILFWWPLVLPIPKHPGFRPILRIVYLFADMIPATAVSFFLLLADFPLYATYELAPPVAGIAAGADQQAAALLMKLAGAAIHVAAITVVFFRWWGREERDEAPGGPPSRPPLRETAAVG